MSTEGVPRALGDGTDEEVRRIAEEALRNVVHHAQAHSVQRLLAYRAEGLALTIRDDGIGLDAMARVKSRPSMPICGARPGCRGGGHGAVRMTWATAPETRLS